MGLLGNQSTTAKLHSLKVTQSLYGICIPIGWGRFRTQMNLLWYGDFTSTQGSVGGKGLGKDGTQYDYRAAVLGALCRGEIDGIGNIWAQNGRLTLQSVSEEYVVPPGGGSYTVVNPDRFHSDSGVSAATPFSVTADDYGSPGPDTITGVTPTSLEPTSGTPGAGQYSQTDGTYTFPGSAAGTSVTINYSFSLYVLGETEDYNIPNTSPYEITVTYQPQFREDLGVIYVDTGDPLVSVGGIPGVGQYNPNGGNYQFNPGDATRPVAISYNWRQTDSNIDPAASLQFTLLEGEQGQAPWTYLTSKHLSQALGYTTIALIGAPNMDLGPSGTLPNYNYEIFGKFAFGGGIVDADLSMVIPDLLFNPLYGVSFSGTIDISLSTVARDYWAANSFFVSPVLDSARPAAEIIEEWCEAGNVGVYWSEGKLKFIPYGDTTMVGNGFVFSPVTSPLVDLNDDDFLSDGDEDPVQINRTPWQDAYNIVKVQYTNRVNNYNSNSVVEQDDWSVDQFKERPEGQKDYSFLCTQDAAQFAANIRLKRLVNIRKTYTFKVSGLRYCFFEPMDLVTLTDTTLGLDKEPARITEIEEDENRVYTITAEEFPWGTATATLYIKQPLLPPPPPPALADPGNSVPEDIFEPTARVATTFANSPFQLWFALTGGPEWGGCDVWLSLDNQSFQQLLPGTRQIGSSRAGIITADLPQGSDPDLANTLSVMTTGELFNVTKEQADSLSTLCKVGTEYLSYQNATLTRSDGLKNSYNMTYLRRGAFSSPNTGHSAADPSQNTFVRIDDQIFKYSYDPSLAGKTVYLKFPAFNLLQNKLQSLSDVPSFPYTISGHNTSMNMTVDSVLDVGGVTATINIHKLGYPVGTDGEGSLQNGATFLLPAYSQSGLPLATQYYVNYNPATNSYILYTDYNAYLSEESLLGYIRIGAVVTASNWVFIPLQGGGSLAVGAGNGDYGTGLPVPAGYGNTLSFATPRSVFSSGVQAKGVNSSTATAGPLLSSMLGGDNSVFTGSSNWVAVAWTPGSSVNVTSAGGCNFVEFTTSVGDTLCIAVGNVNHGGYVPLPGSGQYDGSRAIWIAGMASVTPTGHRMHGVQNCSLDGVQNVTALYSDFGSDSNQWPGSANVFVVYWQNGGNVVSEGVSGGIAITFPQPNNGKVAFIQSRLNNGGAFSLPSTVAGASVVSSAAMTSFSSSGDNVAHGWVSCQTSGFTFTAILQDGEGHTWPGVGNIFAIATI